MSLPPATDTYVGEPEYPSPWTTKRPKEGLRDNDAAMIVSLVPDVCKSPSVPVPYPIVDFCGHDQNYTPTVRFTGQKAMVLRSNTTHVHGDEPGVGKGVKSGTVGDISEPIGHAPEVRAEGSPVIRHLDRFWMNRRNTQGEAIFVRDVKPYEAPKDTDPVPGSLVMSDASPEPLIMGAQYAQTMTGTMTDSFPGTQTQTPTKPTVKPKIGRRSIWAKELVDALTGGKVTQRQIENVLAELDYYATTPNKGLTSDQMGVLGQAAGQIRATALPAGDLEAAEAIKQQAWDKVFAMAKAGTKSEQNVRVSAAKRICFDLPPGMDRKEFERQLKEQEEAINKMTADDMAYAHWVLEKAGTTKPLRDYAAQQQARKAYRRQLEGLGYSDEAIATMMDSVNATHFLDIVAGGNPSSVGIGAADVNQEIGRQWIREGRANALKEEAAKMRKEGRANEKMNVKLEIC